MSKPVYFWSTIIFIFIINPLLSGSFFEHSAESGQIIDPPKTVSLSESGPADSLPESEIISNKIKNEVGSTENKNQKINEFYIAFNLFILGVTLVAYFTLPK